MYQSQLEPKGLTNAYLADFLNAISQYDLALDDVEDAKADRDIATQTRRQKGNEVHSGGKEISEAGKAYWIDKDEARYNDYVFYDTINETTEASTTPDGNAEAPTA